MSRPNLEERAAGEQPAALDDRRPAPSTRPRSRVRRVVAPLILAGAAVAAGSIVMPAYPLERQVELRLEEPGSVTGLEVSWAPSSQPGDRAEAVGGSTWSFQAGGAPSVVRTSVRLPRGLYDVAISVERTTGHQSTQRAIAVDDAERITLPVR